MFHKFWVDLVKARCFSDFMLLIAIDISVLVKSLTKIYFGSAFLLLLLSLVSTYCIIVICFCSGEFDYLVSKFIRFDFDIFSPFIVKVEFPEQVPRFSVRMFKVDFFYRFNSSNIVCYGKRV